MCGIAGILRTDRSPTREEIERITRAMAHRGPDGEGYSLRDNIALGHRRLSIIDPETGRQPLSNENQTLWITANGEIYNYRELRSELIQHGHQFRTKSDTEVILHAYEQWGEKCLTRLRGMFAFCIADFASGILFLARDPFGIKPLVYRKDPDFFAFASEINALRLVGDPNPCGKLESLEYFLRYQYIPAPHTVFRDIFKLPPAHFMKVRFNGEILDLREYKAFRFEPESGKWGDDWQEMTKQVLEDSVRAHLTADVPYGLFMSGGVDSTLLALNILKISGKPFKGFFIGFEEEKHDETRFLRHVSQKLGIEVNMEVLREDSLEVLPDLLPRYGEPFGDSSAVPTWFVSRMARQEVPMVLAGDGGDELFAGYLSYINWYTNKPGFIVPKKARLGQYPGIPRYLAGYYGNYMRNGFSGNRLEEWIPYYAGLKVRNELWKPEFRQFTSLGSGIFAESNVRARNYDRLSYAQYIDIQTYLPNDILTKVDVAGMSHGLEVRPPFLDPQIAGLVSRLPVSWKMNYLNGELHGKYVLKKLLLGDLPADYVLRRKQGFFMPRDVWFLPGHYGRQYLEQFLNDPLNPLFRYINQGAVKMQISLHKADHDNSNVLWLLLVLAIWLNQNQQVNFS